MNYFIKLWYRSQFPGSFPTVVRRFCDKKRVQTNSSQASMKAAPKSGTKQLKIGQSVESLLNLK